MPLNGRFSNLVVDRIFGVETDERLDVGSIEGLPTSVQVGVVA